MPASSNRQILLVDTPKGKLGPEHFALREAPMPAPKDGEVLLRVRYISLDAANRAWMQGATYRDAVVAGTVMAGGAVAEVVESKAAGFAAGDLAFADTGWQDYAALPAKRLIKLPRIEPMTHLLSVYGIAGLTAYFGLIKIAAPREGETVVVSAAAGSVGSIVGQHATGVTVPAVANNLVSVFGLYNPPGSGVDVELIDCDISQVLAATVVNAFGLYYSTAALSALATFTTRGTEQCLRVADAGANKARFYSAVMHSGTPVKIANLGQDGATTNVGSQPRRTLFDGKVIIPPGILASVAASTAAGTASGLAIDMSWAEIPIAA